MTAALRANASVDHFERLGVERSFAIDRKVLDKNYRERSKQVHPDRFVGAASAQRIGALQDSMSLNEAYKVLRKPVSRAEYLLSLYGMSIGDNEQAGLGLLSEFLELREDLADAKQRVEEASGEEAAAARGKLQALEQGMDERVESSLAKVARGFAAAADCDSSEVRNQHLEAVKAELIMLRYAERYLEQFDEDEDESI